MVAVKQHVGSWHFLMDDSCPLPVLPGEMLQCLTPAEQRVAELVARGLCNKEIAAGLNRAEPTIKHQIVSILRKFGLQSRCQLIVLLLRGSFVSSVCAGNQAPAGSSRTSPPVPTRGRS